MTNRITEELITGIVADSNIETISTCKFVRYCLRDEYMENLEFLASRNCDVEFLKNALDDHIEVEDAQLQIFSQVRNLMKSGPQPRGDAMMTQDLKKVMDYSRQIAQKEQRPMYFEDILNAIYEIAKTDPDMYAVYFLNKSGYQHDPTGGAEVKGKYRFLAEYCDNLNDKARKKKIDPLIGRRKEVERIVEILAHYKKKNPMLVGKPGVGKTAVAEGLASLIDTGQVPEVLKKTIVYSLNVGNILAGSKFRGEFEEKVRGILKDLERQKEKEDINAILFIDEVHQVMGAGAGGSKEGVDLANMIKPGLASGDLSCIGATTEDEFNQKILKDKALMRRFQKVMIEEPSAEETLRILEQGVKPVLEEYHGIKYPKEVLERIVDLSGQYLSTEYFPDKAISITDSVGARLRTTLKGSRKIASVNDVEDIISIITGTPTSAFKQVKDKNTYVDLAANIKEVLFGQDEAIDKVVEQVEISKAGLRDVGQPIGSFLLLGPTGVGKTELAKQIAAQTRSHFFQLNMSEYSSKESVSKLYGSSPGLIGSDEGGILTNEIMKYPHTILLLDEIEKAHTKVFDALLGIIDGASMIDGRGNKVDFSNVLILMTSNAGAAIAANTNKPLGLGGAEDSTSKAKLEAMEKVVTETFSPEFRNKLSGIARFNPLDKDIMFKIVEKFLKIAQIRLTTKGIKLNVSKKAKELLAERGFDPAMGARPIKREIDDSIVKPLVKPILKKELESGDTVKVTVKNNNISLEFIKPKPKVEEPKKEEVIDESSKPE